MNRPPFLLSCRLNRKDNLSATTVQTLVLTTVGLLSLALVGLQGDIPTVTAGGGSVTAQTGSGSGGSGGSGANTNFVIMVSSQNGDAILNGFEGFGSTNYYAVNLVQITTDYYTNTLSSPAAVYGATSTTTYYPLTNAFITTDSSSDYPSQPPPYYYPAADGSDTLGLLETTYGGFPSYPYFIDNQGTATLSDLLPPATVDGLTAQAKANAEVLGYGSFVGGSAVSTYTVNNTNAPSEVSLQNQKYYFSVLPDTNVVVNWITAFTPEGSTNIADTEDVEFHGWTNTEGGTASPTRELSAVNEKLGPGTLNLATLEITRDGKSINSGNNTVCVGQQINLTNMMTGLPPGAVTSYQWNIPGANNTTNDTAFYDYEPNANASNYTNLFTPTNYTTKSYCNFYWSSGGTNTVTCTAIVYGQSMTVSTKLIVERPTTVVTISKGSIGVGYSYIESDTSGLPYLYCGEGHGTDVGIMFSNRITEPTQFSGGSNNFVQVITSVDFSRINGSSQHADIGLDSAFPYGTDPNDPNETTDSPAMPLNATNSGASANFNAKMYIIWRAPSGSVGGDKTVWVPLRDIPWNWSATATNATVPPAPLPTWQLSTTNFPQGLHDDEDCTTEPFWTTNAYLELNGNN